MRTLVELQRKFVQGMLDPSQTWIASRISSAHGQSSQIGFAIYRHNVLSNYRRALQATYPAISQLVGVDFFNRAVDEYSMGMGLERVVSDQGDLGSFGDRFGDFLAMYFPAADLLYLPDVARLEWAVEESFHAAHRPSLDKAALLRANPNQWPQLRFVVHPSMRFLTSAYPVLRIWQVNQPDYAGDQTVHLIADNKEHILVMNRNFEVEITPVAESEYIWLLQLAQGETLEQATQAAWEVDSNFDVQAALQRHLSDTTLVDFTF